MTFNYELLDDTYTIFVKSKDNFNLENSFMMNLENFINGNTGKRDNHKGLFLIPANYPLMEFAQYYVYPILIGFSNNFLF